MEGFLLLPYLCIRAHVTCALGNAFFTAESFAAAPWRVGGAITDRATRIAGYQQLHRRACVRHKANGAWAPSEPEPANYTTCKWPGRVHPTEGWACLAHQGWRAAERVTTLRLARPDADALVLRVVDQKWRQLVDRFPEADDWPADAQLGLLSFAWAVGTAFRWPRLEGHLRSRNFAGAALECTIRGGGTIVQRNAKNKALFRNAAIVEAGNLDPSRLYFPATPTTAAAPEPDPTPSDEPTDPYHVGCDRRDWLAVDSLESLPARRAMLADSMAEMLRHRTRDRHGDE